MICTLLRRVGLLPGLVLFLLALGAARPAQASHFLGGELSYRYLDNTGPASAPQRYEVTVTVYFNANANASGPYTTAYVSIYNKTTSAQIQLTTTNYANASGGQMAIPATAQSLLNVVNTIPVPPGCTITGGAQQPYYLYKYVGTVNLPTVADGYYAEYTDGNRNAAISNLANPSGLYLTLYTTMTAPTLTNSSPVFPDPAVAVVCANDTTYILNNAVDADGDQLVYTFGQPFSLATLPATFSIPTVAPYQGGYSLAAPFGNVPGNYASVNSATGLSKFRATAVGAQYVIAVDVKEYRNINGTYTLIGTTRRDIQLVVGTCPPSTSPTLPAPSITPRSYTIEAGSTLTVPLTATQVDNHNLSLTGSSILLDGPGGYDATFGGSTGTVTNGAIGSATVTGPNGSLTTSFVFKPSCTQVRAQPYDVTLTLKDLACAGKTTFDVFRITVVKPSGPTTITGDANVCGVNMVRAYSSSGGTAPKVSWRVVGGTLLTSNQGNPVQVQWNTIGTGLIVARGIGQDGCPTDSVSKTVTIAPAPTVSVAGVQVVCQGTSTSLSFTGSTSYTLTGGGTTLTGAGPFTVSPTQTTLYTVSGVATGTGCPPTGQVTVTVLPGPVANAGAPVSICAGTPATIGAAPIAGYTYSWTPATGLSNPNIANPTVTLTPTGNVPVVQIYTLTVLNGNSCPATASVSVTVRPQPGTPVITGATTACSSATTGTYSVANANSTSTFQWTVAGGTITAGQGTSSITVAYPTTTPNTTISVVETSAYGCVSPSTSITVVSDNAQTPLLPVASVVSTDNTKITLTLSVPVAGSSSNLLQILRRDAGSTGAYTTIATVPASTTTYVDASVNAAQKSYEYSLARVNACGTTLTATVGATSILLQAAQLGSTAANRNGGANLTWNAYKGFAVAGYRLYRQDDNKGYNLVTTLPATTLQYTSLNVGQGFNQCFRVVAFSSGLTPTLESNSNTACLDFDNKTAMYNVITPNGDGLNDKLFIDNVQLYPGNSVAVFNRWGRQVFATSNYNNTTNAWGDDASVAPGVYYYYFKTADGNSKQGWVEVIK